MTLVKRTANIAAHLMAACACGQGQAFFLFSVPPFLLPAVATDIATIKVFVIRVQNDLKPSQHSGLHDWYASTLTTLSATNDSLHHVYNEVFQGFSANLTTQQADQLRQRPEIISLFNDRLLKLFTTRSPAFLGLETNDAGLVKLFDSGANVIIGVIDSGIWLEHLSFDDNGLGPIPSRWKGRCMPGDSENAATFCNKKLIRARHFTRGSRAGNIVNTARDDMGHGTHTASTMAGRRVGNASFLGYAKGVASGIAPKARLAVYKVCGKGGGCALSDVLAGIEQAVQDGFDSPMLNPRLVGDCREVASESALDWGLRLCGEAVRACLGTVAKWPVSPRLIGE
ncbi:hypothetical protein ACLB2K_006655 [Fragaria x ananassa]